MKKLLHQLYLSVIILLLQVLHSHAQQKVPGTVVIHDKGSLPGYVLFAPLEETVTYLMDKSGNLLHSWPSGFLPSDAVYLFPNGDLLRAEKLPGCTNGSGFAGGQVTMYTWDGTIRWRYTLCNDTITQSHDIYPLPNGNVLVDAWELMSMADARKAGRDTLLTAGGLWYGTIREIQPDTVSKTASVVWQWRFRDHLDSTGTNPRTLNINAIGTPCCGTNDWIHMNAVTYNQQLDQVLISSRNLNEIYIIDHSTTTQQAAADTGGRYGMGGNFLYRWGNPANYGRPDAQQLFGQHSPYWLDKAGKQIMINNDGFGRKPAPYTSVNRIKTGVNNQGVYSFLPSGAFKPASPFYTYNAPDSLYNEFMGNAQLLPNGNILICAAGSDKQPPIAFYEIDKQQQIVWDFHLNGNAFRCTQYAEDYLNTGLVEKKRNAK